MDLYFIPSSEFNAYLKLIKVVLSKVKKYRKKVNILYILLDGLRFLGFIKISYFFTSDEYDLYFFTAAKKGYFDN